MYKLCYHGDAWTPTRFWDVRLIFVGETDKLKRMRTGGWVIRDASSTELERFIKTHSYSYGDIADQFFTKPASKELSDEEITEIMNEDSKEVIKDFLADGEKEAVKDL